MVPQGVLLATPISVLVGEGGHADGICVVSWKYPDSGHFTDHFIPMKLSVLSQIQDLLAAYKAEGLAIHGILISKAEHQMLKQEVGAGAAASVSNINGVSIHVGPVSDLPPVIPDPIQIKENYYAAPPSPPLPYPKFPIPPPKSTVFLEESGEGDDGPDVLALVEKDGIDYAPVLALAGHKSGKATAMKNAIGVKVYHKSGSDEHGTPQALFDALHQEFHFDLDVCATAAHEVLGPVTTTSVGSGIDVMSVDMVLDPGNAKCPIYFTKDDNGLIQAWFGTVWMNPPYTKSQVGTWIQKMIHELVSGHITRGVALVAARPDTQWFRAAATYACEIRFLAGRLTFQGSTDPAPFPSAVLVFDRARKTQEIRFWLWKEKKAVKYFQSPGAQPPAPLLGSKTTIDKEALQYSIKNLLDSPLIVHPKLGPAAKALMEKFLVDPDL